MTYFVKLCLLCIILNYDISSAFPQNGPSSSDTKSGFDWKQKGSANQNSDWSSSYGSDDDLEKLGSEVLEKKESYEIRQYPETKWICTTTNNVVPSADPLNNWREEFNNNIFSAMSAKKYKKQASSKQFFKLFKYISGANSMGEEIPMTTPAIVKHIPTGKDLEDMKMCFWLGTEWETKEAPQPIGKDAASTEVYAGKGMKVYVRQFGGFAMSHADYASEHEKLVDDLKKEGAKFEENGEFVQVSYNSPFEMENRVNEVWIEVVE